MPDTYSAFEVARWFIERAASSDAELSNLKLQKLLYYAQGRYLVTTGRPLFREPVEAWDHGPVVSDVYHACKGNGGASVAIDVTEWPQSVVDQESKRILEAVWANEGKLDAWKLRAMTHSEPPWKLHFEAGKRHAVIPNDAIQKFFSEQHLAPSLSIDDALSEWVDASHDLAERFLPGSEVAEW